MHCPHTLWLDISDEGESRAVKHTARLRNLLGGMPWPASQTPSISLFFESGEMPFFPIRETNGVYIRMDGTTARDSSPVLIASTTVPRLQWSGRKGSYGNQCLSVVQETAFSASQAIYVVPLVLLPFVDVLCFRCANQHELYDIISQINIWQQAINNYHTMLRMPEIVVFLSDSYSTTPQKLRKQLNQGVNYVRPRISVVKMGVQTFKLDGLRPIRERIAPALARARRNRIQKKLAFSANHLQELVGHCLASHQDLSGFHYIQAARTHNPVPANIIQHLRNFFNTAPCDASGRFIAETIASAFLLDHWTETMHEFDIREVFGTLYERPCASLSETLGFPAPGVILYYMQLLHPRKNPGLAIAGIHSTVLRKHRAVWRAVGTSHETCLCCLRRRPEYKLPCGHIICLYCVRIFGKRDAHNEHLFSVYECFLCAVGCHLVVLDRPPTSGIGILCLDGGGVRGIIQTVILELLEERIGLPIPIQEYFQLVSGASAGALNIIGLFLKGWSPSTCTTKYETLATIAFQYKLTYRIVQWLVPKLLFMCGSALYSGSGAKEAIVAAYGDSMRFLDPSYASSTGTRVFIPVATLPEPSLLLFTNYNAIGSTARQLDYRTYDKPGDITIADVARSCTAAPFFFPPHNIHAIGEKFQDPGLIENNVITLMPAELKAYYGSSRPCQFILNIGTGSRSLTSEVRPDGLCRRWNDILKNTALNRVASAYNYLLSGSSSWTKCMRVVDSASGQQESYIRLDIAFEDTEPRLDDIHAMAWLKSLVRRDANLSTAIDSMARRAIASLFYFQLNTIPQQCSGIFKGSGTLMCIKKKNSAALSWILKRITISRAKFKINNQTIDMNLCSTAAGIGIVDFAVYIPIHLAKPEFTLSLKWPDGEEYPISGGPFSLMKLVRAQGLDCSFGLPGFRSITQPPQVPAVPGANQKPIRGRKRSGPMGELGSRKLRKGANKAVKYHS